MKSLSQIEPRTPISAVPFTINTPGSYYVATNLSVPAGDAITINASGVTLDLSGFTIASTAGAANGTCILLNSNSDITILNGHIRGGVTNNGAGVFNGGGFANGINVAGTPVNISVSRISISGCLNHGIFLGTGDSSLVESCTVRTAGGFGILSFVVRNSVALDCGNHAINGVLVTDCRGSSTVGIGVAGSTLANCTGTSVSYYGINALNAQNCYGVSSNSTGISGWAVQNSYATSSGGMGISATAVDNCYASTSGSGTGISGFVVQNSYGYCNGSGTGLYANEVVQNSFGISVSGTGLSGGAVAIGCRGRSTSGLGLGANIANSCNGSGVPPVTAGNKYNMP